jgi:hypothetical protein
MSDKRPGLWPTGDIFLKRGDRLSKKEQLINDSFWLGKGDKLWFVLWLKVTLGGPLISNNF